MDVKYDTLLGRLREKEPEFSFTKGNPPSSILGISDMLLLPQTLSNSLSTVGISANIIYSAPIVVPRKCLVDGIFFRVSTAANGFIRVGLYKDSGQCFPGSLIIQSDPISTSTAGVKPYTFTAITLEAGLYWYAFLANAGPTLGAALLFAMGVSATNLTTLYSFLYVPYTYGELPSTFPTSGITWVSTGAAPIACLRIYKYL